MALCALFALACTVWNLCSISVLPPSIAPRDLRNAGAEAHVLIDRQASTVQDRTSTRDDFDSLDRRAVVFANLLASQEVRADAARRLGIDIRQFAGSAPVTVPAPAAFTEPGLERRASGIQFSKARFRIIAEARPLSPEVDIYTAAPTVAQAKRLADATIAAAQRRLHDLTVKAGLDRSRELVVKQLGPARGGSLASHTRAIIAFLTFVVAFAIALGVRLVFIRARMGWGAAKRAESDEPDHEPIGVSRPVRQGGAQVATVKWPALTAAHGGAAALSPARTLQARLWAARIERARAAARGGDWPNTTRVLPWMIAAFIVMLWLVPFNSIELSKSTPIDMHLDRLVLPFIVGLWLMAMVVGGRGAPRIRLSWIHAAVGGFIAVAFLSVVLDARYLNETLELVMGLKKLVILVTYGIVFLIVASTVRREEVPAYLKLMLWCAVICSLGIIFEYRTHTNLFYQWTDKLLPGIFRVDNGGLSFDDIGRPAVIGPAQLGLEAVGMLTMAVPIAIVGLLQANRPRDRILYGLATIVMMAAAISTYRKSAFIAPIAAMATIAYFRRHDLLRLAPLGLVGLLAVHVISPGALGSVTLQLHSKNLNVPTVMDRKSDYDAIRPDVWSHLAFGRGFGTYDHTSYRILDSEILMRLVETGVVGLVAYLLMTVSIVLVARRTIRSGHPKWAPIALIGAAAAVGFTTMSSLYDVLSFPHPPYILLCLAGMVAVVAKGTPEEDVP